MVIEALPSIEIVRFVNSGTEATMSAIRLARGFTGRDKIVKFDGCYHGHADGLLVAAGSGVLTLGVPTARRTSGLAATTSARRSTISRHSTRIFHKHGDEIAAVIVEPIAGNMGVVPPRAGFLRGLRELTPHTERS